MSAERTVGEAICDAINEWEGAEDARDAEKARCLAIATDVLTRGPGFPCCPCCPEFADGYSNAAQQIAAEIEGGAVPITVKAANPTE